MAKQTIQLGTPPTGSDGDTSRTAFEKTNQNFDEVYSLIAEMSPRSSGVLTKGIGGGAGTVGLTDEEANNLLLILSGSITGNRVVELPSGFRAGSWFLRNETTGAFQVSFKTASGSGVVVPRGAVLEFISDGVNVAIVGNQGRTLIQTQASTGVANVFSNLSGFDVYELEFDGLVPVSNSDLGIHLSTTNGSSWITTNNYQVVGDYHTHAGGVASGGRFATVDVSDFRLWTGMSNNGGAPNYACYSGRIKFFNFRKTDKLKQITWQMAGANGSVLGGTLGEGRLVALHGAPINALRIFGGASGFSSGTMTLYGENNS